MTTPPEPTLSRIADVIARSTGANVTPEQLGAQTRLDDLVPLDSLALLEFATELEKEFAVRFEPEQMTHEFFVDLGGLLGFLRAAEPTP
jgi:acyl carrier protein